MRVLVTGHDGYIGSVLVPLFSAAGHEVVGLDSLLFDGCAFGDPPEPVAAIRKDIRDVTPGDLEGFDLVVHLAAISNDPLGDLNPDVTMDINFRATESLAKAAKAAGVPRFLYSSSCSLYGAHGDAPIDETAEMYPVTPYGESKVLSEQALMALADDTFSPTYLRNATAYGVSPRLRGDLVVNNLTGFAFTTGQVFLKSDGRAWRPLVHIEDISRAFLAIAEADVALGHNRAFNVGATDENYLVRDVAEIVESEVEGSTIVFSDQAAADLRNYRVNCDLIHETFPNFVPQWTVRRGVQELRDQFAKHGLTIDDLEGDRFMRIRHVRRHLDDGSLSPELRWN
jgi:nucleoside-diphosphate-sugar epimerase